MLGYPFGRMSRTRRSVAFSPILLTTIVAAFSLAATTIAEWSLWLRASSVMVTAALMILALERRWIGRTLGGPFEIFLADDHSAKAQRACLTIGFLGLAAALLWVVLGGDQWGWASVFVAVGGLFLYWGATVHPDSKLSRSAIASGGFLLSLSANFIAGALSGSTSLDGTISSVTGGIERLISGQRQIAQEQERHGGMLEELSAASEALEGPVLAVLAEYHIDLDRITASDFEPRVEVLPNGSMALLRVNTSAGLEALADAADVQFKVGDRPWSRAGRDSMLGGIIAVPTPQDLQETGPVSLRFVLETASRQVGRVIGPFQYPIDLQASVRSERRKEVENSLWLENHGGTWATPTGLILTHQSEVRAMKIGASPQALSDRIEFPSRPSDFGSVASGAKYDQAAVQRALTSSFELLGRYQGIPTLYVQLEYRDGTTSEVRKFDSADMTTMDSAQGMPSQVRSGSVIVISGSTPGCILIRKNWEFQGAIRQILVRQDADAPEIPIDLLPDEAKRIDPYWIGQDHDELLTLPPDWTSAQVKIELADGTSSPWTKVDVPKRADMTEWIKAPAADQKEPDATVHFGHTGEWSGLYGVFRAPRGTVRMLWAVGERPFQEVHGMTRSMNATWLRELPSVSDPLRVVFQLADGTEIGPVSFSMSELPNMLRRSALPTARTHRRELIAAGRIVEGSQALQFGSGRVGVTNLSNMRDLLQPGIVCALTNCSTTWAAIQEAQLGPTPDKMTHSIPSPLTAERILTEGQGMLEVALSGETAKLATIMPLDTKEVWVRFKLVDGTTTDPVQVPIEALQ
jgi:hypothetical protein